MLHQYYSSSKLFRSGFTFLFRATSTLLLVQPSPRSPPIVLRTAVGPSPSFWPRHGFRIVVDATGSVGWRLSTLKSWMGSAHRQTAMMHGMDLTTVSRRHSISTTFGKCTTMSRGGCGGLQLFQLVTILYKHAAELARVRSTWFRDDRAAGTITRTTKQSLTN